MRMLPHIGTYLLQRTEHQNLAYSGAAGARLGSATDRGCRRRRHRDIGSRAPEKKFPLFCQIGSTRKAAKKWLNGQKSGPTDKKVDLNGQKKYPNGTKIVRWFHYFCPLVQFWFLFQAGTFFAAFLGGPSKGGAKNRLEAQCTESR